MVRIISPLINLIILLWACSALAFGSGVMQLSGTAGGSSPSALYTAATVVYDFENNGDDTKEVHDLTNNNTVTFGSTSPPQGSYYADLDDASSQYFSLADHTDLDLDSGDYTIAFWVKFDSSTRGRVVDKSDSEAGYRIYSEYDDSGVSGNYTFIRNTADYSSDEYMRSTAISTSGWQVFVFTYDTDTNTMTEYSSTSTSSWDMANGTTDVLTEDAAATTAAFWIGRVGTGYFNGQLDEFVIWKGKTLTSTEAANFRGGSWR